MNIDFHCEDVIYYLQKKKRLENYTKIYFYVKRCCWNAVNRDDDIYF